MIELLKKFNYRCEVADRLIAEKDIKINSTGKNSGLMWQTTSESPSFIIGKKPILPGWYMLEVNIEADTQYLDCTLTITMKNGKVREHVFMVINSRLTKRVILIPIGFNKIQLIPAEKKINLTIHTMRFVKLMKKASYRLMHKKLLTYKPDSDHTLSLHIWRHYELFYKQQHKSETDYNDWVEKREYHQLKRLFHIKSDIIFGILIHIKSVESIGKATETINSIQKQTYLSWIILLIADKTITEPVLKNSVIGNNKRKIKAINPKDSTLSAVDLLHESDCQYFLNLTNGEILSPYALSILSRVQTKNSRSDLVYADNDLISPIGVRNSPTFKPDWNPNLMLSTNYIGTSILVKRSLLKANPDLKFDPHGLWTYGLLIKKVFGGQTPQHVSEILTHSYPRDHQHIAIMASREYEILKEYTAPHGINVSTTDKTGVFQIIWPINNTHSPLISIIIPTRDNLKSLKRTIDSLIIKTTYTNYEILIVDNQSRNIETKQYFKYLIKHHSVKVLEYNNEFNYSAINNFAANHAKGELLCLLNNDVEIISPVWLREMASHAIRFDIGCVGAKLYYPNNEIQHGGVIVGLSGCAGHSHKFYKRQQSGYMNRLLCTQDYSAVTGACLLVRKELFVKVGGLNQNDLSVAFNDVDLCLKIKELGYRNIWTPWAELYHYESLSRGQDDTKQKRARLTKEISYMKKTWNTTTTIDPHYNKRLTRLREDFSLGV